MWHEPTTSWNLYIKQKFRVRAHIWWRIVRGIRYDSKCERIVDLVNTRLNVRYHQGTRVAPIIKLEIWGIPFKRVWICKYNIGCWSAHAIIRSLLSRDINKHFTARVPCAVHTEHTQCEIIVYFSKQNKAICISNFVWDYLLLVLVVNIVLNPCLWCSLKWKKVWRILILPFQFPATDDRSWEMWNKFPEYGYHNPQNLSW